MSFLSRRIKQKKNIELKRSGLSRQRAETSIIEKKDGFNGSNVPFFYPVNLRLLNLKTGARSVKFPVDGLDCPTTSHAIQHYLSGKKGIESVIANCSLDYFFVTYQPREIQLSRIIDLLNDWGIRSNVRIIYYPIPEMFNPEIVIALTRKLLSCRFLLDLEWNDGLTGLTMYVNPDYIGHDEAKKCIDKIITEELTNMNSITKNERNDKL